MCEQAGKNTNLTIIQVMGSGRNKGRNGPDEAGGQVRCDAALEAATKALEAGHKVCIIVAAGNELWHRDGDTPTMATVYGQYLESWALPNVEVIVNSFNHGVWGTIAEMREGRALAVAWVDSQQRNSQSSDGLADMADTEMLYASDLRHLLRISRTYDWIIEPVWSRPLIRRANGISYVGRADFKPVVADHPPNSWGHEMQSYAVLCAHVCGLGAWADRVVDFIHLRRWMRQQQMPGMT